jgi:hypothetical protein
MSIKFLRKEGDEIVLELTTWVGPLRVGDKGKDVTQILRAPIAQGGHSKAPRGIVYRTQTGHRWGTLAPSVQGFADIIKRFKWGAAS